MSLIFTCLCIGVIFLFFHQVVLCVKNFQWKIHRPGSFSLTPPWVSNSKAKRNKAVSSHSVYKKSQEKSLSFVVLVFGLSQRPSWWVISLAYASTPETPLVPTSSPGKGWWGYLREEEGCLLEKSGGGVLGRTKPQTFTADRIDSLRS